MTTQAIIQQALNNHVFDERENFKVLREEATINFADMLDFNQQDEYIVHAPPQMGKTGYMLNACQMVKNSGILIVISVDNKKDQLDQTFGRFSSAGLPIFKVSDMKIRSIQANLAAGKSVVVFCLNNASQVGKLCSLSHSKITVIHDEGDLVYQSDSEEEAGKTQQAWDRFCVTGCKRVWVSATPENCSFIRGICTKNILRLPYNPDYTPVTHFCEWDCKDYNVLSDTFSSLNPSNREVTLFCTDSTVKKHDSIAENISLILPDCVVIVYNGTESFFIAQGHRETFTCGISEILTDFEDGDYKIIVVGHALLSRGISFCSAGNSGRSYMATRMFYLGDNAHAVALSQRFGRIAGTCRPDLNTRTVYCSREVYANYIGYLDNQAKVLDTECDVDMISTLSKIENKRNLSCKLDRITMKKMNKIYKVYTEKKPVPARVDTDFIPEKAKRLVARWKNPSNMSAIAVLYRDMVLAGGKMKNSDVRSYIKNDGPYAALTGNHVNSWNMVFSKDSRYHYISNL